MELWVIALDKPITVNEAFLQRIPDPVNHVHRRLWMEVYKFFKPREIISTLA